MTIRPFFLSVILLGALTHAYAQDRPEATGYLAKVGDSFISEKEFVRRFEMLPAFQRHRRTQIETAKTEFLYTLIAEKLLAQEARSRNLQWDSDIGQELETIRRKLSRDELYHREIINKLVISEQERADGMAKARILLFLRYLCFEKAEDATFIRQQMKHANDFDHLLIDASIHAIRDTASVVWGDADPLLENAAYGLRVGEISDVIAAGSRYYLVKVVSVRSNPTYALMSQTVLREKVTGVIRLRKERALVEQFMRDALKDKTGYSIPRAFLMFADTLKDVYGRFGSQDNGLFAPSIMDEVRRRCHCSMQDTLTVVGTEFWTVSDIIDKLTNREALIAPSDTGAVPGILNRMIEELVQQRLLEDQALQRGLDRSESVQEKLAIWTDAMLSSQMKRTLEKSIIVSESEILSFMKANNVRVPVPSVKVRLLVTGSMVDMTAAVDGMQNGMTLAEAVRRWSIDSVTRVQDGITDFFPVTERVPIGEQSLRMQIGEKSGPISSGHQFVYFELLAKKDTLLMNDTAFVAEYARVKSHIVAWKFKKSLNEFLAQAGSDRGFAIYEDRLKKVNVTRIPMMTFRILGFGGRLFEVPFVDPQLEWLNVDPPQGKILP